MSSKVEVDKGPGSFSFHGRASRREWLWAMVQTVGIALVAAAYPVFAVIITLPWTIRFLAVTSRRLHDLGLSGWLQLIPIALMAATLALFFSFQNFGIVDYGPFLGAGNDLPGAEVTLEEMLSLPPRYTNFLALPPLEALPMAMYWVAGIAYIVLYAGLLLVSGADGPNPYGEADRN